MIILHTTASREVIASARELKFIPSAWHWAQIIYKNGSAYSIFHNKIFTPQPGDLMMGLSWQPQVI